MFVDTEVRPAGEPAKVGTMKLSDAMRIGARIRPQCETDLFRDGRSCAMGAAYEGATGQQCLSWQYSAITSTFPVLGDPAQGGRLSLLGKQIYKMNDRGVSREAIADWLESEGY